MAGLEEKSSWYPPAYREHFQQGMGKRGRAAREAWMAKFREYHSQFPQLADHLLQMQRRQLPDGWDKNLPVFPTDIKGVAGRDASANVLNALAKNVPWLLGGSADLAPSTKTPLDLRGSRRFHREGSRRSKPALRRPGTCNGLRVERTLPLESTPLRLRLPDFQRLQPGGRSA
jgi:Transketolase